MNKFPIFNAFVLLVIIFAASCGKKGPVYQLDPAPGSSIVFIGNTFAERLQDHNYFETLIYKSFPDRKLRVRNLAWSADEVNLRPRPVNFGSLDEHLRQQEADIIFAAFGLNEAFKGPDSLDNFRKDLRYFLNHLQQQDYNGAAPPQVILLSPIAHEALGGFLPDPSEHNRSLKAYVKAMREVARDLKIPFIDLFEPTAELGGGPDSITTNGIHLNERGYLAVSQVIAQALKLPEATWTDDSHSLALKNAIGKKNQHYFYRFKAQNGEYIYGRRRDWAGGEALPAEARKIDRIVARLDSVIWAGSAPGASIDGEAISRIIHTPDTKPSPIPEEEARAAIREAKSQFVLADGYEVELFASEIDFPLVNPVAITFDPKGRMWVATMPSYPHYLPGSPPDDQLVILEDTDGDGKADTHRVFADSLYLPLGFELGHGGVFVTAAPDLIFLEDTDGDDRADRRRTLLSGFGTEDSHHTLSSYTWGPDGALYFHMGTFLHSQVETPYGPRRGAYGTTWRYEPRTMKLEPYISYPYANPWGNVFTRNGTHIIADVSTGMNYFAPPLTVAIDYPKKHMGMRDFLTSKVKPKTCGVEIVCSRAFPEDVQGNVLFNTFIGFQGVRQHVPREEGSGIIADEIAPLIQSKDPNFRPVDLKFGPDGALYIVDWYDPIIQHGEQSFRDPLRDRTRGRIWRVTYKGKKTLETVDLTKLTIEDLLDRLTIFENRERYRVRTQLSFMPAETVLPALESWLAGLDSAHPEFEQHRLEGLWVYQQFNRPAEPLLNDLLQANDPHVRAAAVRVLYYWADRIDDSEKTLASMAEDPAPRVRLEAVATLSHFNTPTAVEALLAASKLPLDDYLGYALIESFKHLKPVWMDMFGKNPEFLADEPEQAAWLFRPLLSKDQLAVPGFIQGDPDFEKFGVDPLSQAEIEALQGTPAFDNFRRNHPELFTASVSSGQPTPESAEAPERKLGEVVIKLAALPGKMLFDTDTLSVPAGKTISLIFNNQDQMPHNVVIVQPDTWERVGEAADKMAVSETGYEENFVPDMPEVLFATPLVGASEIYQLDFTAPSQPGEYPFLCTFPGHWRMMRGILTVVP